MTTTSLTPYARLPRPYHALHVIQSTVDASGHAHWLLSERKPDIRAPKPYDALVVTVDSGGGHREMELGAIV